MPSQSPAPPPTAKQPSTPTPRTCTAQAPWRHMRWPSQFTVAAVCAGALAIFLVIMAIVARFPSPIARNCFGGLSLALYVIPLVLGVQMMIAETRSWLSKKEITKTANLRNTVLTVNITIPLMVGAYIWMWYPGQRQFKEFVNRDTVSAMKFPAVAVFQRLDFTGQANLLGTGSKCFLGWYIYSGPNCSSLTANEMTMESKCDCKEDWSTNIPEGFVWYNTSFRYLLFQPTEDLISPQPTYLMMLQVFFNYNLTQATIDSGFGPQPSLSIAVFDPDLTLEEAMRNGYTSLVDINANAATSINLDIVRRQNTPGADANYDYSNLVISSVPALDLVCNTATEGSWPCVTIIKARHKETASWEMCTDFGIATFPDLSADEYHANEGYGMDGLAVASG
ncbi:hypothetical protein BP5796_12619 [Coleophoma crateriformis]|uniref:Uncharacterized protein n=1 Tax=Coleophoma crateriformis TaxID=565419 RepID=A0A3D8Q859_9HELO|nr:hypothetical protein BP5796_12619 [Coleophoma crateriformis]